MFRTGGEPAMKDNVGLRAGVLDDQSILDKPPAIEVYVERRPRVSKPLPWRLSVPAGTGTNPDSVPDRPPDSSLLSLDSTGRKVCQILLLTCEFSL